MARAISQHLGNAALQFWGIMWAAGGDFLFHAHMFQWQQFTPPSLLPTHLPDAFAAS